MDAKFLLVTPLVIAMVLLGLQGYVSDIADRNGIDFDNTTQIIPTDEIVNQSNAIYNALQGNTITSIPLVDDLLAIGGGVIGVAKLVITSISGTWTLTINNVQSFFNLPNWFKIIVNAIVIIVVGLMLLGAFMRWRLEI